MKWFLQRPLDRIWEEARGRVIHPVPDDPNVSVHCALTGKETTLGSASEQQGDGLVCYDCEHRRPCGRLRMSHSAP